MKHRPSKFWTQKTHFDSTYVNPPVLSVCYRNFRQLTRFKITTRDIKVCLLSKATDTPLILKENCTNTDRYPK